MKTYLFFLRTILRIIFLFSLTIFGTFIFDWFVKNGIITDVYYPEQKPTETSYGWMSHTEWSVRHCWIVWGGLFVWLTSLTSTVVQIRKDIFKTFPEIKS